MAKFLSITKDQNSTLGFCHMAGFRVLGWKVALLEAEGSSEIPPP